VVPRLRGLTESAPPRLLRSVAPMGTLSRSVTLQSSCDELQTQSTPDESAIAQSLPIKQESESVDIFDFESYQNQEKPSVSFDGLAEVSNEQTEPAQTSKPVGFFAKAKTYFAKHMLKEQHESAAVTEFDDFELKAIAQDFVQ
jgi:hypothetical protein